MDQLSQYLGSGAIKGDTGDTLFVIATGANNMIFDANTAVAQTTGDIVSIMKRLGENGECRVSCMLLGVGQRFHFLIVT
jgi:hypothetical protein